MVARQGLAARDVAQLERKALEWREARRLGVEMTKIEPPPAALTPSVLADETIKPSLQPTGQIEIGRVDSEDQRVVEDRAVEPVWHNEFDAIGSAVRIGALGPFVDPREPVHAPLGRLAQRGRYSGGLQPIERRLQAVIIARARAAAGEGENLARRGHHQA